MAPPFIACTDIEMSPCPVMKMIGSSLFAATSSRCKSRPLSPGNLTSSTRQVGHLADRTQESRKRTGTAAHLRRALAADGQSKLGRLDRHRRPTQRVLRKVIRMHVFLPAELKEILKSHPAIIQNLLIVQLGRRYDQSPRRKKSRGGVVIGSVLTAATDMQHESAKLLICYRARRLPKPLVGSPPLGALVGDSLGAGVLRDRNDLKFLTGCTDYIPNDFSH
jgi:hypothetical protein